MTPQDFIARWQGSPLSERAGAQAYFLDLCDMLGVDKPNDPDNYCFERGATRTGAGHGWADVWKRGCFAWENKAPGRDLGAALKQLMTYALALDNPPLLVVCDREIIQIHTHFTGTPSEVHTILLADIGLPDNLDKLRRLFQAPNGFRPDRSTFAVTEEAAARMGAIAKRLAERGNDPQETAHFLIQCVFCMFAEDARLLPEKLFETVLDKSNPDGAKAQSRLAELFCAMQAGGDFALHDIPRFNGGLFARIQVPALTTPDVVELLAAARMNWRAIEPAILGTLFERGLNPDMRSQLGAHYTDPATIMKLITPVIEAPLMAEWEAAKAAIAKAKSVKAKNAAFIAHLERLKHYRVLDPACGSGNFLYLALKTLKDLEHRANLEAETLGLHRQVGIEASPANVLGIELNPYAAELARVTVWIGEIQWMLDHGYAIPRDPILAPLDHIECRDAILTVTPAEAGVQSKALDSGVRRNDVARVAEPEWPAVDAIVGNPPFLGGSKKRGELGDATFEALNKVYKDRVPGGADLVTYWFEKARAHIVAGKAKQAGLVATQAIRAGSNRKVLERIIAAMPIFAAWCDEEWINNGAAVRVSLVCYGGIPPCPPFNKGGAGGIWLDGQPVAAIHADLTAGQGLDLTQAKPLAENAATTFEGTKKYGDFDIPGELARQWLRLPNPNGRPNAEVVKPWANGKDLTGRPSDTWIIDFGTDMPEASAALYEAPFAQAAAKVKGHRTDLKWWLHERPRPELRKALRGPPRYVATPRVAKHRFFVWLPAGILPDTRLNVIATDLDTDFGILSSRIHVAWALAQASIHGDGSEGGRPTYNAKSCFETFPFPAGLTPRDTAAPAERSSPTCLADSIVAQNIAAAARRLDEQRNNWLNPPEWVDWVRTPEEEQAGFPARPVAKAGHEAELKQRTLTNLYNQRAEGKMSWLDHAHRALDAAVAAAYGWTDYTPDMPDAEILARLLALNLERSGGD
ncbi:MAG: class I SAM-dependent DNA methyltransferase [Thiobacillus sp.]|nr:class I SAM-dependent DNA methyltransferase [Thiobacillus sp.]